MATVDAGLGHTIGLYVPGQMFVITPSSAEETANTLDVDLSRYFHSIKGINITILDSGNNAATSDVDVTWSGTTVTIADGSSYDLQATDTIYLIVFGTPKG